jgi:hypothetical protein
MGLDVVVEGAKEEYSFRAGGYIGFNNFRDSIIAHVKGEDAAREREQMRLLNMATMLFGPGAKAACDLLGGEPKAKRVKAVHKEYDADWDIFFNHSDCDGEFNQEESKVLHALFKANRKGFLKGENKDYKEIYDHFIKAFALAKGKKEAKVCFC